MKPYVAIPLSDCKKGMITAEPVFNNSGGIIIGEGIKLNDNIIEKLDYLGIYKLKISQGSIENTKTNNNLTPKDEHLIEVEKAYNFQVYIVEDVIKDINSGKTLDIEKIDNVVKSLTETFSKDKDIIDCFRIVKDVDEYLYTHSINVSLLSALIGKWIGLEEKQITELTYAGLLHDIGKAKISFKIVNKREPLTQEEKEKLKEHVTLGHKMLETIPNISKDIKLGVLMHHEKMDGEGYPLGAKEDQIHIYGKILAIASKYDHYINILKRNPFKVFESIRSLTFGELDPSIALTFLKKVSEYYIGDMFTLNTGEVGEVISINNNDISRPLIKVDNTFVNLSEDRTIEFREVYEI